MPYKPQRQFIHLVWILFFAIVPVWAQNDRGELQVQVRDPQGAPLVATGELVSEGNQVQLGFHVRDDGQYIAENLAFGIYRVSLSYPGFVPITRLVEVRSKIPVRLSITMGLTPVQTDVEVSDQGTLVDPSRTSMVYTIGSQLIAEELPAQPGRGVSNLVNQQPGWLYEANGILHPRGSEYDVQFIVDGVPLTEKRSPAFAPPLDSDDVESMRVITAGFPAEYGRKLGGVVEMSSISNVPGGLLGELDVSGGSFTTASAHAALFYSTANNRFMVSGNGFHTDRYLDPPVLDNFTNRGNSGEFSGSYERNFRNSDRLFLSVARSSVRYLVPNELLQQQAGQRQDASQQETTGTAHFTHVVSPNILLSISGSLRDTATLLSSNPLSTPVIVFQDRGYREGYARVDLSGHHGRHEWKMGADGIFNSVRETLSYQITDPDEFDPGTQPQFHFADRGWDIEPSAFVQDQIRLGKWNVSLGLRYDHYGFVVHESAWSPRAGISREIAAIHLVVHASYDRVFQTPAMENLLLASSPQLDSSSDLVLRLPVRSARGNYYEAGVTKSFAGKLRVDANIFRRQFSNYSDDDTLLDTGVSFPIAFANAHVYGEEIQISVPHWGRFSGFVSYANQTGVGNGPITGGLFLGDQAANATSTAKFAITQDQRNTVRARIRLQATSRLWFATSGEYGSGLPVSLDTPINPADAIDQFGSAIVNRVNFDAGRVRPNFSLDIAAGATLYHKERKVISMQVEGNNLTDRVNVINFANLFSGTAVAAPRSVTSRLKIAF